MYICPPDILARIHALQPLERMEQGRDRFRRLPGGDWWPSVTTVLQAMPQPWAKNWAAKVERELVAQVAGEQHAGCSRPLRAANFTKLVHLKAGEPYAHDRIREVAANIGTEVHDLIEWNIRRELGESFLEEPKVGEAAERSFGHWRAWRRNTGLIPLAAEREAYHEGIRTNCRVDWIGIDAEGLVANDWKSGNAIHVESHLQLAANIMCLRDRGIPVRAGWIVQVPKAVDDPVFKAVKVGHMAAGRIYSVEELFEVFCHVKATWDWLHHRNKPALTGRTAPKPLLVTQPVPLTARPATMDTAGAGVRAPEDGPAGRDARPAVESEIHVVKPLSDIETARVRARAMEALARAGITEPGKVSETVRELLGLGSIYELGGPLTGIQWTCFIEKWEARQRNGGAQVVAAVAAGTNRRRTK